MKQEEALTRLHDPVWRLHNLYHIQTKDSKIVKFNPNPVQARFYEKMTTRNIILKARQMGLSTAILMYLLDKTIFNQNQNTVIIAHQREDVIKLFRKIRLAYDRLPKWCKPETKYDTKNELYFAGINSRIEVALQNRGDTITNLHVSEVAFIKDAREKMLATFQAVPENGIIFLESTPKGVGNYFHSSWVKAVKGENDFEPHFYSWFHDPTYKSRYKIPLDEEDEERIKKLGLTKEQAYWRKKKVREIGERDFRQEYPEDDKSCFLSSGNPVFDSEKLDLMQRTTKKPLVGELKNGEFSPDKYGKYHFWEKPLKNCEYVIGADVSEGGKSDYSCAIVLKRDPIELVAKIFGNFDPDHFADYIIELSKLYNMAFTGVEINGPGLVTCMRLERSDTIIPLYKCRTYDTLQDKYTEKIGWRTTAQTKPLIIEGFVAAIRDDMVKIKDEALVSEMFTYERDARGRTNATKGCHDDHVMACAIALEMHHESPPVVSAEQKEQYDIEKYTADKVRLMIGAKIAEDQKGSGADPHLGSDF